MRVVFVPTNGKRVIIEMQALNVPDFEKRILHNAAKEYANRTRLTHLIEEGL